MSKKQVFHLFVFSDLYFIVGSIHISNSMRKKMNKRILEKHISASKQFDSNNVNNM